LISCPGGSSSSPWGAVMPFPCLLLWYIVFSSQQARAQHSSDRS
jgi:hypothetical protein